MMDNEQLVDDDYTIFKCNNHQVIGEQTSQINGQNDERVKKANGYSNALIEHLRQQRYNKFLCDIEIEVEGHQFYAHKCLLAASSDYFDAMARSGMMETRQDMIKLKDITASGFKIVLDFIYSGELKLSLDTIGDIIRCISHLQVQHALKLCEEYLIEETTVDNCIEMFNLADLFSINSVKDAVNKYILRNFSKLIQNEQYKKFTIEQMSLFMASNKLKLYPEIRVFNTIIQWIKANESARLKYASELLQHCRFCTMKPEEFIDIVSKTDIMKQDPKCNAFLIEAYEYFALPHRQYCCQFARSQIRNEPSMVCVNESMYILNRREENWQYLCHSQATCKTLSQKFVVVNNFLYACGGYSEINRETTDKCHRFDPRTGTWHTVASMNEKRQFFTLTSSVEFIVAVGGVYGEKGNFYATYPVKSPIELYSIEKDNWKSINCSAVPILKWPGACVFNKNQIFIVGGKLTDGPSHNLSQKSYIVDLATNNVQLCDPPLTTRFNPSVFYIEEKIILFGGEDEKYRMAPCIEIYDIKVAQWSEVATIPVSLSYQCISSTCLLNNKIYYLLEEHGPSSESYILRAAYFDIQTYKFEKPIQLPHPSTLASKWCNLTFPQEYLEKCQALSLSQSSNFTINSVNNQRTSSNNTNASATTFTTTSNVVNSVNGLATSSIANVTSSIDAAASVNGVNNSNSLTIPTNSMNSIVGSAIAISFNDDHTAITTSSESSDDSDDY